MLVPVRVSLKTKIQDFSYTVFALILQLLTTSDDALGLIYGTKINLLTFHCRFKAADFLLKQYRCNLFFWAYLGSAVDKELAVGVYG
jgi:hypothetical protein